MDAYDMIDAVDISDQITPAFFTQMESKKWSDRKEALEVVEKATAVPKIANTDFSDLVRILKKTIAKDSNIVVVASAAKCLCQLAQGLRTEFSPHASYCMPVIFEKFKEKKPNVISILRDAADAVFVGTNLENTFEDIIRFLDNKNPQIKSEMALFLARTFSRFPAQVLNKKTLRPLINSLIKTLSDMDATVRDNSAMAIGTAMKVTGEKLMMTLIADVEPIKLPKIKEFCEKAEIQTAPMNGQCVAMPSEIPNGQTSEPDPASNDCVGDDDDDNEEQMYNMLEAIDISSQITPAFFTQMESKKWSDRKEALEVIEKATAVPRIANADLSELVRVLKKTIAKDSNIVVVTLAAKCLCQLAQGLRYDFSQHASYCMPVLFEKFKEKKPNVISVLQDAADAVFVGTNLENTFEDIIQFLDNKNPQIKSEMALFLVRTFSRFPAQVLNKKTLRPLINSLIKTLSDMDATVRDNSAMAIGTAMKVTGEKLMMTLIADVEPIKLPKIKEFCEKAEVKKIPKSQLVGANAGAPAPAAPQPGTMGPPTNRSSATMVRSTGARTPRSRASVVKPPTVTVPAVGSNATVKRTATIIKRPGMTKQRTSGLPQPPPPTSTNLAPSLSAPAFAPATNKSNYTANLIGAVPPPQAQPLQQQLAHAQLQPQLQHQLHLTSTPAKPVFATTALSYPSGSPPKISTNGKASPDSMLIGLISDDPEQVVQSVSELDELLANEPENLYKSRINQIIYLSGLLITKNFETQRNVMTNGNLQSQEIVARMSDCLTKLFSRRQLISTCASQQSIRFLLAQLFTLTETFGDINENNELAVRTINDLVRNITDEIEPSTMMCILTGLLNDPAPASIVEPIKRAIIRSMKSFK